MNPNINTQSIINAIENLTVRERFNLDELLHSDPIAWHEKIIQLANQEYINSNLKAASNA